MIDPEGNRRAVLAAAWQGRVRYRRAGNGRSFYIEGVHRHNGAGHGPRSFTMTVTPSARRLLSDREARVTIPDAWARGQLAPTGAGFVRLASLLAERLVGAWHGTLTHG